MGFSLSASERKDLQHSSKPLMNQDVLWGLFDRFSTVGFIF